MICRVVEGGSCRRGGGGICTREGVEHAARLVVEDVDAAVLVARGCESALSGLGFLLHQYVEGLC